MSHDGGALSCTLPLPSGVARDGTDGAKGDETGCCCQIPPLPNNDLAFPGPGGTCRGAASGGWAF